MTCPIFSSTVCNELSETRSYSFNKEAIVSLNKKELNSTKHRKILIKITVPFVLYDN
jgi:hypothetical protein